ncbi:hypothetical protein OV203_22190 [Nannocystis sp. ILAH1]|uniref:hypothetical protein n=1 Tax=Nannocystis sp. ILAH1 TaxID=2996789 RepID=UPI00226D92A4|nr:hypothetical protein [Nannocystis sp. ILAH1]MCY0989865.1 hypothetical protein [Nannocystis sp. ILAH1]
MNYLCDPGNWTDVDYAGVCTALTPLLDLGPVLAALGSTAAQAAAQLPCDLSGDCSELLDFWAREAMWTPPDSSVRYTAEILTEALNASMSLLGNPPEDLVGQAAYTPVACGAAACPLYLAQLDLGSYTMVRVPVTVDGTQAVKGLDGLSIGLVAPTLGMWLPSTGDVIFPPDSLRVRLQVRVTGEPNIAGENGSHDQVVQLKQYVFGTLVGDSLTISTSGTDLLGNWSVNAEFEPVAPQ